MINNNGEVQFDYIDALHTAHRRRQKTIGRRVEMIGACSLSFRLQSVLPFDVRAMMPIMSINAYRVDACAALHI